MLARLNLNVAAGAESQRLYWAMGALAIALLPHLTQVPSWIPLAFATGALWRIVIETRALRLPPRLLRIVITFASITAVALTFRTLNGLEAGTALLATMAGVKLLETRGERDCTILVFIGYVLLFAALLYDQSLLRLPYILASAWLLTVALLHLHQRTAPLNTRSALRRTGAMVLQALPLAVLLFLFFPRLPGQFWALPTRNNAATGLSDEMAPGDISELTISGEPAFRAKFNGPPPPQAERYWRGPVLHDFDGRRWRRDPFRGAPAQEVIGAGTAYSYRITLEPTQRPWLFALDVPVSWSGNAQRLFDLQLIARRPLTALASYDLESRTAYSTSPLPRTMRLLDTALPGSANPRTRALALELRASVNSDVEFVQAVLNKFRNEAFHYTLTPPTLGDDSVDEFLFATRRGFCEHYSSAFTTLMRAAGLPARVVTGYQGGEYNQLGEYLLVRQSDAHAWSEVWIEDRGWVRVDPTAAVAPERIERSIDAALPQSESVPGRFLRQSKLFSRARLTWDAINNFWNDRIVQYNEMKQRSILAWLGVKNADWRSLGLAFGIALVGFFVTLTLYLGWQYRPRALDPAAATYDKLCRKLARARLIRAPHEGPADFLERAASVRLDCAQQLHEARTLYTRLRYEPAPSPNDLRRFKLLVRQFAA